MNKSQSMTWKELLVSFCLSETHSPGMNEPIAIRLTPADALLALSAYDPTRKTRSSVWPLQELSHNPENKC